MANEKKAGVQKVEARHPKSESEGLLTSAARAIGGAIGKVSTTLHLGEPVPVASRPRKEPATKKALKKVAMKKVARKAAPVKKPAKRVKQ